MNGLVLFGNRLVLHLDEVLPRRDDEIALVESRCLEKLSRSRSLVEISSNGGPLMMQSS